MAIITGPLAALKLAQIVAYDSTLNDAAKRTFLILAGYADSEGCCWPSVKKIASRMGVSRQAIIKQINILIEHDYISRTANYNLRTKRRETNIYQLNYALANIYIGSPQIFCKRNVTLMVTYLVTLLRYRDMALKEVTHHVNELGDINITNKTEHIEHNKKEHMTHVSNIARRKKSYANAWQAEKEREHVTGVTSEHKKTIEMLTRQLRQYLTPMQITQHDIEMKRKIKEASMSPLEGVQYIIRNLQETVTKCGYIKND